MDETQENAFGRLGDVRMIINLLPTITMSGKATVAKKLERNVPIGPKILPIGSTHKVGGTHVQLITGADDLPLIHLAILRPMPREGIATSGVRSPGDSLL
jgi:hypothetical protein